MFNRLVKWVPIAALLAGLCSRGAVSLYAGDVSSPDPLLGDIAACSSEQPLTITAALPDLDDPTYGFMRTEMEAEAGRIGGVTLQIINGQGSAEEQASRIRDAIVEGVDTLIVASVDDTISGALQSAIDTNVPLITLSRRTGSAAGVRAHVGVNDLRAGEQQALAILQRYPNGARLMLLEDETNAADARQRLDVVRSVFEQRGDLYPFVTRRSAADRRSASQATASGLAEIEMPPDAIIAATDTLALGALDALTSLELAGRVAVYGYGAEVEMLSAIQAGTVSATIEDFPGAQARAALRAAVLTGRGCAISVGSDVLLEVIIISAETLNLAERFEQLAPQTETRFSSSIPLAEEIAVCPVEPALTIAVSLPDLGQPIYAHMQRQLRDEAELIGGISLSIMDGQANITKQIADIETATLQGVNALIVVPIDGALEPALRTAGIAGIPIITVNRQIDNFDGVLAHVGVDSRRAGEVQSLTAIQSFPEGADIVVFQNQPEPVGIFAPIRVPIPMLPDLSNRYPIMLTLSASGRAESAGLLQTSLPTADFIPDIVFAPTDAAALGAADALAELEIEARVAIYGFGAEPDGLAGVRDGVITGTVELFPGGQARAALRLAALFARGCPYSVQPTLLIEPALITRENLEAAERLAEIQ